MFTVIRDWVYENYEASYIIGVGALALIAWTLDPKKRTKYALGAFASAVALGTALEPCVNVKSQTYGPILAYGSGKEPLIALTFDDGPSKYTESLLDVLREENVKATFFCVGKNALEYPDMVRRARDEGHLVGSHTFSHVNLLQCTPQQSKHEIESGALAVSSILGERAIWFRPPYGMRYPWTLGQARSIGLSTVMWSNCPRDWQIPGEQVIAERIVKNVHNGDIVLLHDGGGERSQTIWAVRQVIRYLRAHGYRFVRVDELT